MTDAFFRAGVGAVVLDDAEWILVMKRKSVPDEAWQLPQGGINAGETPLDALYRELQEETGLARGQVEMIKSAADWWTYELPAQHRNAKVGWGQTQRWFLCRLRARRDAVRPDGVEFTEAEWVRGADLLRRAAPFRLQTYRKLIEEFGLPR